MMETRKCTVEKIVFHNKENGYTVMQVSEQDCYDYNMFVGTIPDVMVGSVYVVTGEWQESRYGRQFAIETFREEIPSTILGMQNYLGSGLISGIGTTMAKRIVKHFGIDTIKVIEKDPDRLMEVEGIGKGRAAKIRNSWMQQKGIRDVMIFLQGHGISATYAAKIYKVYKKDSIRKVKENPYCLADDIFGIGFKMADTIAENLGFAKDDIRRIKSGILYTLNTLAEEGHCFSRQEDLVRSAGELLSVGRDLVATALSELVTEKSVILDDNDAVYLPIYFHCERNVARKLRKLNADKTDDLSQDIDIEGIFKQLNIEYNDIQADAIREALRSKVMVLTGLPGTGKTATTKGILTALESKGKKILCAAPTGRAAKRMYESTGREAKTIHRMLEYKPDEGFKRNENFPLGGDVLIVDESSMIDILLMNSLLKAVPDDMRLILVGDIDQLPSVGAGNVLRDIIDSGVVPVVRLTKIFRQALTSRIVTNAHKVNQGMLPDISNGKDTDFFFINNEDAESVAKEIENIVKNRIPSAYGYRTSDIQVLTPMRRGAVGTIGLNMVLQAAINPTGESLSYGNTLFRVGDRVMQIKNNYEKNVFNGDVGIIEGIDNEENIMVVSFDGEMVAYERCDLHELTLAYACTIHKSQGSEYPVVVMPILMSHYVMLQRNLIYTGITRAKKICVIIGSQKALAYAVKNMVVLKRNTLLKERLKEKENATRPPLSSSPSLSGFSSPE